jgi:hypothetical protein
MANSFVRYVGDGSTSSYSIPFSYRTTGDLTVTISGTATTAFTLNSAGTTLTFNSTPASNAAIEIRRRTSQSTKLVDYASGSVLTENDLDTDSDQAFFMSQEAIDDASDVISLDNADFQYDVGNKRLKNVTDPTSAQDAATKNYVDTQFTSSLSTINSQVTSATTQATNSANSATSSASSATSSASSATASAASATAAQTAQTAAETALDTFDDRFLGAKSSNPTVDNDGNALLDGTLFFDTTNDVMKVYNLANTTWYQLTNTTSNQNNINTVAGQISPTNNISTLAGKSSELTALGASAVITDMGLLGTSANVAAMGHLGTSANVTNMANLGTSTNVTNMATLAGITNLTNLANAHSAVSSVSSNLSAVQNFADVYRISSSAPTSSLNVGDLYFDTTANELKVYKSSGWSAAGSTVNGTSQRFTYNISGTPTTVSGSDANGNTLAYDAGFADVYVNGVRMSSADITITSGSSVVFASALANGDVVDVVAYGTFNVASINAANISSGTINNDRLPAPTLIVKGDGSSADGQIQLNCSQNSHGVKIKSPPHSSAQSYTLVLPTSVGTNGQVLATNGNATNQLSWVDAQETKPTVANVSQTVAPATATTISITGTNFVSIPQVDFVKTDGSVTRANTVSFTNATTLSVNVTLASGNYYVLVTNPDGNAGRSTNNIITSSTAPTFSTNAGSLGTFAGNFSGTIATIAGSSDSAVSFSEVGSNLSGANVTLSSAGVLATTDFGGSSTTATQYNFTIRITDAEGQTADRAFSFTSSFGATGSGGFN